MKQGPESVPELRLVELGVTKSGEKVFDRPSSHIHGNETVEKYLPLALERIDSMGRDFIVEAVDFGEEIGVSMCVETTPEDEIVYAVRPKRRGPTRFVKNREGEPTSEFTVILKKVDEGYIVITAFVGPKAEKEPWDPMATEESKEFWNNHALIWESEEVIPGTESTTP
ncbi:MAG TPA: hypothetical protein PLD99_00525 [Parcubacteria group bacterium]|nr:hypothetical protein [Parcubacteria group bacterium]